MPGLRLAFPSDHQRRYFTELLEHSGLALQRGNQFLSTGQVPLDRIVGVSSTDLPVLLLDGVFDAVLTTADRVAECEAAERTRKVPRPFGRVIPLTSARGSEHDPLVWGFPLSADLAATAVDAETELFDMARGGLEFTPGRTLPRTVLCATTHPAIAAETLGRLGITGDIRYYPDPWAVVADSGSYCGLGLLGPKERAQKAIAVDPHPIAFNSQALIFNQVAWASSTKQPQLKRLESALLRFIAAQTMVKVECRIGVGPVQRLTKNRDDIHHLRLYAPASSDEALETKIELVVNRDGVHHLIDQLAAIGATQIVVRNLNRADVRP